MIIQEREGEDEDEDQQAGLPGLPGLPNPACLVSYPPAVPAGVPRDIYVGGVCLSIG